MIWKYFGISEISLNNRYFKIYFRIYIYNFCSKLVFKYLFKIYYDFSESRRKNCQTTPCAESRVEAKLDNAADQIIITKNSASRKPRFPSKGKKKDNWARYFLWWNPAKIHTVEKQPCKHIFRVGRDYQIIPYYMCCKEPKTFSCPLVCYFRTLFWDDVTIIHLLFCQLGQKRKRTNCCRIFLMKSLNLF